MDSMYMRIFIVKEKKEKIVAICDKELVGKKFTEGATVLDLQKYGSFYKGTLVAESMVLKELKSATSINLVGERSLKAAKKSGLTGGKEAILIQGVPHLQIYRM